MSDDASADGSTSPETSRRELALGLFGCFAIGPCFIGALLLGVLLILANVAEWWAG